MIEFFLGIIVGVAGILFFVYNYLAEPLAPPAAEPFIDQFRPCQIPEELRAFLKSGEDGQGISKWESCFSISLLLHMLFQEHKDTRQLRRWVHKRLQMELNDLTTRTTAGRLIQEIQIRELSLGAKFVTVNSIRVEKVEMSQDKNIFEKIIFVLDIDYSGGFETAIDVASFIAKRASLSVKITKLTGLVRVVLSRQPYNYWTFSFVSTPVFETEISSQIQGHQLKRVIPIIKEGIRRALQRKHVWPNYKIRYRPIFPNPLFQASSPPSCFAHVKLEGGMEVTVLQCSRLKNVLLEDENKTYEVYCTVAMDHRPLLQSGYGEQGHCVSVMLTFSRFDLATPVGIVFEKAVYVNGSRPVRVLSVEDNSLADKASFKPGDVLVAINNVPIRSERQAVRFLQQTTGDLLVLVERSLDDIDDDELKDGEVMIGDVSSNTDDSFLVVGELTARERSEEVEAVVRMRKTSEDDRRTSKELSVTSTTDSLRRHSVSNMESSIMDNTDSLDSSLISLDATRFDRPNVASVQRTESARVPQLLVSQPSFDLRRTRSESQIDVKSLEAVHAAISSSSSQHGDEEKVRVVNVGALGRVAPSETANELGVSRLETADKDKTLTQMDAIKGAGSMASLSSMISTRTDRTTDNGTGTEDVGDEDDGNSSSISRNRPSSTRRQKLHATLAAGKKRVLELIPQKRRSTPVENSPTGGPGDLDAVEVGTDAGLMDFERESNSRSPLPPLSGKRSPVECHVVDKKEKKKWRKKGDSPRQRVSKNVSNDSPSSSMAKTRSTKPVQYQRDVVWGQSLHFELDPASRSALKYLNVTVHAKEVKPPSTTPASSHPTTETPESSTPGPKLNPSPSTSATTSDPPRPILLGSVSLYLPQIIDDCRLTLSNCHREVFHMKPPLDTQPLLDTSETISEFSRHAGFDPRLCYGDITLGFRYFPDGLPSGAALNSGEDSDEEVRTARVEPTRPFSPPLLMPSSGHDWKTWYSKSATTCAMCRGKIWLRNASCCSRCLAICHNKCVVKANNGGIACSPHQLNVADSNFEDLATYPDAEEEAAPLVVTSPQASAPATPATPADQLSKRLRLRNKVSEKLSNWRRSGKKKDEEIRNVSEHGEAGHVHYSQTDPDSPGASVVDCLSDFLPHLEGSPFIATLYFQPGNAFDEPTIRNAQKLGKKIFAELPTEERKLKINEQIDRIHLAQRETKDERLVVRQNEGETSPRCLRLEDRLQALAILMLHYCSGLQDCDSSGRSSPSGVSREGLQGVKEDVDAESVADEDATVTDEVPKR